MSNDSEFKIDLTQGFPHLNKAPIIEAVIEIRARAETVWEETAIAPQIKGWLPEYPKVLSMNAIRQQFTFGPEAPPQSATQESGWTGLQFQSTDGRHVAKFTRDSFVFSRLQPYESWEQLDAEAMRLWKFHIEAAKPAEIQRLGVRFINRISMRPGATRFEDYIKPHPETPRDLDLPFLNFLHRNTLIVPGRNYGINLAQTLQIPQDRTAEGIGIILDIDIFTMQPFLLNSGELERRLTEMRWLKNKAFFGTITPRALEDFG